MPKTKILIIDTPVNFGKTTVFKCTGSLQEWLRSLPDVEVEYDLYADPEKLSRAQIIWCEPGEYAAVLASQRRYDDSNCHMWNDQVNRGGPGAVYDWSEAKLIIRIIDIDALFRSYRGIKWENVSWQLFIAPHIERFVREENGAVWPVSLRHATIPLGLDTKKWTYRERDTKGNGRIAYCSELWNGKQVGLAIQAFAELVRATDRHWSLHVLGRSTGERTWLDPYTKHILKDLGISDLVTFTETVDDMDGWLESMDYSISASAKEAFSLVTAEAAAKGMKPLTHNWEGARDFWPDSMVWTSVSEFVTKMQEPIDSKANRAAAMKYDFDTVIKPKLEKIIFG